MSHISCDNSTWPSSLFNKNLDRMQTCNRKSSQHTCCSLDALHSFVYKQFFYLHHVLHLCPAEVIELPDRSIDDLGQLTLTLVEQTEARVSLAYPSGFQISRSDSRSASKSQNHRKQNYNMVYNKFAFIHDSQRPKDMPKYKIVRV